MEFSEKECSARLRRTPCLSFGACGFYYPYITGVCEYVIEEFENWRDCVVLATSGGIYPAIPFLLGQSPLAWLLSDFPACIDHFRKERSLGALLDRKRFYVDLILRNYIQKQLGISDAHTRLSGRLFVNVAQFTGFSPSPAVPRGSSHARRLGALSLSRDFRTFPGFTSLFVSHFESEAALMEAILATQHFPAHFLSATRIRGVPSWDGGLALPLPRLYYLVAPGAGPPVEEKTDTRSAALPKTPTHSKKRQETSAADARNPNPLVECVVSHNTITISPVQTADVCPQGMFATRVGSSLSCPETLNDCLLLVRSGYQDARRQKELFLQRGFVQRVADGAARNPAAGRIADGSASSGPPSGLSSKKSNRVGGEARIASKGNAESVREDVAVVNPKFPIRARL